MESCYSVELAADDAVLELPWSDPEGIVQFFDTAKDPTLILEIPEQKGRPELLEFLMRANGDRSGFTSAKCDVWSTEDLEYEDVVFNATTKLGGYIDLVFTDERRYRFEDHEAFAREFAKRVRMSDDIPATSELIVRRLYEHGSHVYSATAAGGTTAGKPSAPDAFYFTLYVFGFGSEEAEARGNWAHALKIVADALF
jgi:hypothetical protein